MRTLITFICTWIVIGSAIYTGLTVFGPWGFLVTVPCFWIAWVVGAGVAYLEMKK